VTVLAQAIPSPAGGAAIPLMYALALVSALSWVILWGLRVSCVDWMIALLRWFQKHSPSLPVVGNIFGDITGGLATGIEDTVGASLSYAAGKFEQGAVFWFHGANSLVMYIADSLAWDFGEVTHGFRVLVDSYIPWAVKEGRSIIYHGIDDLGKQFEHITRATEAQLSRGIDATNKQIAELWRDVNGIRAGAEAAGKAGAIPVTAPLANDLTRLEGYIRDQINSRIGELEKAGAAVVGAGAIAAVIEKEWPFWKCSNVKSAGKALCHMPIKALEGLLGLLGDALVFSSICSVLPTLEKGLELIEPEVVKFTSGAAAVLCRGRYKPSATLAVPTLHLPSESATLPTLHLP
jgi:hypothetical protein